MTKLSKLSIATVAVVLGLASAALASGPSGTHGRSQSAPGHTRSQPPSSTTTTSGVGTNAKAYGRACEGESKQHVSGRPGTPFSKCVTDMAQLANNSNTNPHRACANESKQHVAGEKGTPYSQCVVAAAKLRGGEQDND